MSLLEKINGDLKSALKSREMERVGVLRFLLAQLHNREIEKKGMGKDPVLTDEEATEVLYREAKKRREAIHFFKQSGRQDLILKEENEISFFESYLPRQLGVEEVEGVVDEVMRGGVKDFNVLMKEAMKKLKGQADGKVVSEIIKKKVGGR